MVNGEYDRRLTSVANGRVFGGLFDCFWWVDEAWEKGIGPLRRDCGRQPMGASQSDAGYDPGTLEADRFVAVLGRRLS